MNPISKTYNYPNVSIHIKVEDLINETFGKSYVDTGAMKYGVYIPCLSIKALKEELKTFTIEQDHRRYLIDGKVNEKIIEAFSTESITLPDDARICKTEKNWWVIKPEKERPYKYKIEDAGKQLNVYTPEDIDLDDVISNAEEKGLIKKQTPTPDWMNTAGGGRIKIIYFTKTSIKVSGLEELKDIKVAVMKSGDRVLLGRGTLDRYVLCFHSEKKRLCFDCPDCLGTSERQERCERECDVNFISPLKKL